MLQNQFNRQICAFIECKQQTYPDVSYYKLNMTRVNLDQFSICVSIKGKMYTVFSSGFVHHIKRFSEFKLKLQSGNAQFGSKLVFFVLRGLENWWMTLENNRAPLLYYIKLCASFQSHGWIQTGVTVRKRSIRVKIGNFLSRVTLKFEGWPWKIIGHLYYVASSFLHHFIAISEFKLELQSGNAQFGSKSMFFGPVWPWNLTDDLEKQ